MYTLCRKRPLYYMGLTLMVLSMGISKTRNGTHCRMAASVCVLCSNCVYCVLQVTKIVDEAVVCKLNNCILDRHAAVKYV